MVDKAKRTHQKLGPARVPINLKNLGPAMRALPSDQWRAAAVARFHVKAGRWGGNAAACRAAGFGREDGTSTCLKQIAYKIFHDPRMLEALHELGQHYLRAGVPDALTVVHEIMSDTKHKDRLKAAQVVINYAHPIQTAHHVTVEHVDDRRMLEFAMKLADEMGIEASKLIGRVDGRLIEHEESEDKPLEQAQPGR
jgi:hypothetical protein